MDGYKELYYDRLGKSDSTREKNIGDFGDVSERKEMRETAQCKDFEWYLKNQMPDLYRNRILGAGEILNSHHQFCLDQQDTEHNVGLPVLVFDCHGLKGNQYWYYRSDKKITRDVLCIGRRRKGSKNDNHVELVSCEEKDTWDYDPRTGLLKHEQSDMCLKVTRSPLKLWLKPCSVQDTEQRWFFTRWEDDGIVKLKSQEKTEL